METAPWFRDYVRQLVTHQLGISEGVLEHGGMSIYTTLDMHMQQAAEAAVNEGMKNSNGLETALISMDPRNGHVKYGRRNELCRESI